MGAPWVHCAQSTRQCSQRAALMLSVLYVFFFMQIKSLKSADTPTCSILAGIVTQNRDLLRYLSNAGPLQCIDLGEIN